MTTLTPTAPTADRALLHADPARRAALLTLGASWAGYLLLRPYGDETTLAGAEGIASEQWIAAHLLGMLGFVALAVAMVATWFSSPGRATGWRAVAASAGAVLVLPYYGAESFGLHTVASEAVARGDVGLLEQMDAIRYGALAMSTFGVGLLLVIGVGVSLLVAAVRRRDLVAGALGVAVATMPLQFFVPAGGRMAHGVLVLLVCLVGARRAR